MTILLLLLACKKPDDVVQPELVINEVVSDNRRGLVDPASTECPEHDDWVEVLNVSSAPIELEGVELHDEGGLFPFPSETLAAGGRVLIWADGQAAQGEWHAPFAVSRDGERLQLVRDGQILDEVVVPALPADHSWARLIDGGPDFADSELPTPGEPNSAVLPDDPCFDIGPGFDDHAYPCMRDRDSFSALSRDLVEVAVVKFDIFAFQDPLQRRIAFMDSNFYSLHDQFYIYTILNGAEFEGLTEYPTYPGQFDSWPAVFDWALGVDLDALFDSRQLRFAGERLYSPYFYDEINGVNRDLGVGTVVYRPATTTREEIWGFELEAADAIDEHDLAIYFDILEQHGPPEFSDIVWFVRSTVQEDLAQQLEAENSPLAPRIVRYTELTEPGEVEIYNPGLTAGRTYMVRAGQPGLEDTRDEYILVLDEIPDFLPPCSALITSVPQTPLSHVSLLARSRGIPNLYVAGVTSDPAWDAWKRVRTPLVLEASENGMRVVQIDLTTLTQWTALLESPVPELVSVDPSTLAYTLHLATAGSMLDLRPEVGGKAAGMRQLLEADIDTPDTPLAVTVRAYFEHLDGLPAPDGTPEPGWLTDMLATTPFQVLPNRPLRHAVLEGQLAYAERYTSSVDAALLASFLDVHPPGNPAGDLVRSDGLRGWIATHPLSTELSDTLHSDLQAQFSALPTGQGLRFRSSSTVEDIEGFNGAGLYTSETGFLDPGNGPSVNEAIQAVWASYWGSEAFEERDRAGIDHLAGGMGLLVHPRFDDAYERANTVMTLTRFPDGTWEMLANAQIGSISVANPPTTCPAVLPEQNRVTASGITRIAPSSESDGEVLSDAELQTLFEQSISVATGWLEEENRALAPERQREVLTLDLEARAMNPGWVGSTEPRLVIKQARSLDPSSGFLPEDVASLPAPEDLLGRTSRVERTTCVSDGLIVEFDTLFTDPLQPPEMGYADVPFVITVDALATADLPELEWTTGTGATWSHLDLTSAAIDPDGFTFVMNDAFLSGSQVDWGLSIGPATATGGPMACSTATLWASPDEFLLQLLEPG